MKNVVMKGEYQGLTLQAAIEKMNKKYIHKKDCKDLLDKVKEIFEILELSKKDAAIVDCVLVDQDPFSYIDYSDLRRNKQNWEYFT